MSSKLPPYRWQIEKQISFKYARFAMLSTCAMHRGSRWLAARGTGLIHIDCGMHLAKGSGRFISRQITARLYEPTI